MVWSLALCPDDAMDFKARSGGGVRCGIWRSFPGEGSTYTVSIQEDLDQCLDLYRYSDLGGERYFRLVIELTHGVTAWWSDDDKHPACVGPPGDFNGQVRGFGHGAIVESLATQGQ